MRLLVLILLAGALLAQAPSTPAPSVPAPSAKATSGSNLKSIGTMKELMLDFIFPTSNEVFYVGRNENKSLEDWEHLQYNALMLAESANLLMAENRARDQDQWMKDAKLLRDCGEKAYTAAKAKDLPALKALNDELYEACQSCHVHYRPGYRRKL